MYIFRNWELFPDHIGNGYWKYKSLTKIWRLKKAQTGYKKGAFRRSNGADMRSARISVRSTRGGVQASNAAGWDNNFVRNSLQMQSRDFEQLCEFMMRVNPFYDSSEGWKESSEDETSPQHILVQTDSQRASPDSTRCQPADTSIIWGSYSL